MVDTNDWSGAEPVRRIAVVGAGTMGHGIAVAFATGDCDVTLFDADEAALRDARTAVDAAVSTLVEHDAADVEAAEPVLDAIAYESSLPDAVGDADLVVEAVPEDLAIKTDVFRRIDRHAPGHAVLASNTSSLSITELGDAVDEPSRLLGTHWFHPPHIVPVVEVVKGEETGEEPVRVVRETLERVGKSPVVLEKEVPGFIGNRIQSAMAHEAWSLLREGVASAEDIDTAVKGTFGFRLPALGVFEKGDHSGLDVHATVLSELLDEIDRGTEPSESLTRLVEEGRYGAKTGAGVYDWADVDMEAATDERDRQLLSLLEVYRQRDRTAPPLED